MDSETDRIAEIEGRLSKATPNSWKLSIETVPPCVFYEADVYYRCGEVERTQIALVDSCRDTRHEDLEFIANAPTDIAYLLAEVKSKDAEIARLRGLLREVYKDGWYAEAIEYPCDYCDEMKDLARRVLAELDRLVLAEKGEI